jgi:hypothetical protein
VSKSIENDKPLKDETCKIYSVFSTKNFQVVDRLFVKSAWNITSSTWLIKGIKLDWDECTGKINSKPTFKTVLGWYINWCYKWSDVILFWSQTFHHFDLSQSLSDTFFKLSKHNFLYLFNLTNSSLLNLGIQTHCEGILLTSYFMECWFLEIVLLQ